MKKIIKKIVMLIILLAPFGIMAKPSIRVEYIDNAYSNRIIGDSAVKGKLGYIYIDGSLGFCIDPLEIIGSDYSINNSIINDYYTEEQRRMIQLIIHYGSGTHMANPYYYMATQELIWEIGNDGEYYFTTTDSFDGERIDLEMYKKEIMDKVAAHDILPDFGVQSLTPKLYDKITLQDKNGVINRFISTSYSNNIVQNLNDEVILQILDSNKDIINFSYSAISGSSSNVYVGNGQTLLTSSMNEIQKISLEINPSGVSYYFKVTVKENRNSVFGKIKFKIFNLDTAQYVQNGKEYETNYFAEYTSDFKLDPGNYQIVYVDVPRGYISSKTVNYFTIDEDSKVNRNNVHEIFGYINIPVGQLNINRRVKEYDGTIHTLDDIQYNIYALYDVYNVKNEKIYSANDLVGTISTVDGHAELILPLGNYYVVEQQNSYGVEVHPIQNISFVYDNATTDFYYANIDILTEVPTLNLHVTVTKEEIDGSYQPYANFTYGLYAKEDIIYLNEVVIKKGTLIKELSANADGIIIDTIELPYGSYEIKEHTTYTEYDMGDSINIDFNNTTDIYIEVAKKLKRGNLLIKIIDEQNQNKEIVFTYNQDYRYPFQNQLLIENIKVGNYIVHYDKDYIVEIKNNETTILEIVIPKSDQSENPDKGDSTDKPGNNDEDNSDKEDKPDQPENPDKGDSDDKTGNNDEDNSDKEDKPDQPENPDKGDSDDKTGNNDEDNSDKEDKPNQPENPDKGDSDDKTGNNDEDNSDKEEKPNQPESPDKKDPTDKPGNNDADNSDKEEKPNQSEKPDKGDSTDKPVNNDGDTSGKEEKPNQPENSDKGDSTDKPGNNATTNLDKEEINNITFNNENLKEELPNTSNYLKKYCFIFELFLIAGMILKIYAKKN